MEKKIIYKGTQIFLRHELYGLVHTAGTEVPLPRDVLARVKAMAKKFGVEVIGDRYEYGLQVKAETEEEVKSAVEKIKRFLDYSEALKINWW